VVAQNGQSIETGNAGHTRQRIKTKQKQTQRDIFLKYSVHNFHQKLKFRPFEGTVS
jgi:hypothetical protein